MSLNSSVPRVPRQVRPLCALVVLLAAPAWQTAEAAAPAGGYPALAPCNSALSGYAASEAEVAAHRRHSLPTLHYPFGTRPEGGRFGVHLTLRIDEAGQVTCYRMRDEFGKEQPLNEQRRALLQQVSGWKYTPFTQGKKPVTAVVVEAVAEDELPQQHVELPAGPVAVHYTLSRTPCQGPCPVYTVEVGGDGQVVYRGMDFVDVVGEHHYTVPMEEVAGLLAKVRAADLWSLRPEYRAALPGASTVVLTVRIGGVEHRLVDYMGEKGGMPASITALEQDIDKVAHSQMWVALDAQSLAHLKEESFNFASFTGGDLFVRAVAGARDEQVELELLKLGVPLTTPTGPDERLANQRNVSLLQEALLNGQGALADALIAKGQLQSAGKLDPQKLDAAFRAAIVGGRLALVQKIWNAGGTLHPRLTYFDSPDPVRIPGRPSPVTLLLAPAEDHPWEGLAIVKFLEAQGCDLKAVSAAGVSLLNVAVIAHDTQMVRYLLAKGAKDPAHGNVATALQSAQDEDLALLLLTSGASSPPAGETGRQYRTYVDTRHWVKVAAWLKAHPPAGG